MLGSREQIRPTHNLLNFLLSRMTSRERETVFENIPAEPKADVRFELVAESKVATAILQNPEAVANFQRSSFSLKSAVESHPWQSPTTASDSPAVISGRDTPMDVRASAAEKQDEAQIDLGPAESVISKSELLEVQKSVDNLNSPESVNTDVVSTTGPSELQKSVENVDRAESANPNVASTSGLDAAPSVTPDVVSVWDRWVDFCCWKR